MSTTREQFQSELEQLKEEVIKMANLSGEALSKAVDSLFNQDIEQAKAILEEDKKIDELETEINEKSVLLIAKQQPVATDLRQIIMSLRVVTDVERMGDNAKNIAKATIHLDKNLSAIPEGLKQMHEIAMDMLKTSMHAFKYEDITIASKLAKTDDKVDKMYKHIVSELLGETATNPDKIQYIMQVAFCARYLERFADHITNIGESILYLVKGKNYNLN
ncbi:phosphate signaling complex protein PhoU [Oceanobacillus alkalisoli]|uniref:phosphate signaling complex protein PhoU n=1 Tax=Oceanobacillus alkalisoli TaxID=2925113 RepID=UPI001EF0FBBE|nr:phosphate signaling complex protein PhoU [Oceanobacillus alkalisoli]MCF3941777.1 phosphate signaling complex protein PhoU [Oceanobacillus alkalisoli]MCG5103057.1 phosphate signaling complex protein PhoU [Oceanobacillus alkalisoli]